MIIRSKQIEYIEDISTNFVIKTRISLLKKALSNIASNAVNYTPANGKIYVHCNERTLMIDNSCIPLSETRLAGIYEPFYPGDKKNKMSNGLGLSIVKQIFGMLHIKYSFLPLENKEGMRFCVFFE